MRNPFADLQEKQKQQFLSDATKSKDWRIAQLDAMERMLNENRDAWCQALFEDFRNPAFEQSAEISVPLGNIAYYRNYLDDLMAPEPVAIPKGLEECGNSGVIFPEPYGPTLVIGPFNCPVDPSSLP